MEFEFKIGELMKYQCEICNYIYDSQKGDPEYGFEAGVDFEELPEDWICPICGVGKELFTPVEDANPTPPGESPLILMMMALSKSLWQICGRGSCAVTREIGRLFIQQLKNEGRVPDTEEEALELVKEYFINSNKFALDLDYHFTEEGVEMEGKNCRFYGICSKLEDQKILISTCPYSNTAAAALEEVTGFRHRISKEPSGYGHKIYLKKVSKIYKE